jgi:hypothetical protein
MSVARNMSVAEQRLLLETRISARPALLCFGAKPHRVITVIQWRETDFAEFFGVAAVYHDGPHSYEFEIARDGLRLLLTLFDLEGAVYVSIWGDGLTGPLFTVVRESCTHAQLATDTHGRRCLEIGSPDHPVNDIGIMPSLVRGVRLYVDPQFRVESIDVEPRGGAG